MIDLNMAYAWFELPNTDKHGLCTQLLLKPPQWTNPAARGFVKRAGGACKQDSERGKRGIGEL